MKANPPATTPRSIPHVLSPTRFMPKKKVPNEKFSAAICGKYVIAKKSSTPIRQKKINLTCKAKFVKVLKHMQKNCLLKTASNRI